MARLLTQKKHEDRLQQVKAELTAKQMAVREETNAWAIYAWAKYHGITLTRAEMGRPKVGWEACFEGGMTAAEAAKAIGSTIKAALSWAYRKGVKWPDPFVLSDQQKADIRLLMKRGGYRYADAHAVVMRPKVRVEILRPEREGPRG